MSQGKGSRPRPLSVSREEFSDNWDRVFGTGMERFDDEEYVCLHCERENCNGCPEWKEPEC